MVTSSARLDAPEHGDLLVGGRRDEGSRPGSPAANFPECFRSGALAPTSSDPASAGFRSRREPERPSIPDDWLRLPTVKSLGLLRTDARG